METSKKGVPKKIERVRYNGQKLCRGVCVEHGKVKELGEAEGIT